MTRSAIALLIAGTDSGGVTTLAPGSTPAVASVGDDLRWRFAERLVRIAPLDGPSRRQVLDAFADLRASVAAGDLFVVMFAGHGAKPAQPTSGQQWYLSPGEFFDDVELADQLLALDPGVDAVVISDCCYGEGFFRSGANLDLDVVLCTLRDTRARRGSLDVFLDELEREQLAAQVPVLGRVLRDRFTEEQRDSPMVCISGAAKDALVDPQFLPDLAGYTVHAARDRRSYAELDTLFEQIAAGHRTFHVDARPDQRLNDRVLGT